MGVSVVVPFRHGEPFRKVVQVWKGDFLEPKVLMKLVWGSTADLPWSTGPWGEVL